ncbi:MAG TPA: hypothetical protein VF843_03260 [Streptosporangiaceae bacterium]
MHRHIAAALLAAAGAVAVVAAGLAGAVPATAGPVASARPVIKTVIDTNFAGYVTAGPWRFRYVGAEVPIAKCRKTASQNASARVALASGTINQAAHIDLLCGGGPGSVRFGTSGDENQAFRLSPRTGDVLKVNVYRDVAACRDRFSATNTRTRRAVSVTERTRCTVVYRHAQIGATLTHIGVRPPVRDVRLWSIRGAAMTSYNGTKGTICGPWAAEKHLAAPVIAIRMVPSALSSSCRDFSLLLKGSRS